MWDLGLSIFLALSGVSVVDSPRDCLEQQGLMGGYVTGTNLMSSVKAMFFVLSRILSGCCATRWCMPSRKISISGRR